MRKFLASIFLLSAVAWVDVPTVSLTGAVDYNKCNVYHVEANQAAPVHDDFSVWVHTVGSGLGSWGGLRVEIRVNGIFYASYGFSGDSVNDLRVFYVHPGAISSIVPHSGSGYIVEARLLQYVGGSWGLIDLDVIPAPHP